MSTDSDPLPDSFNDFMNEHEEITTESDSSKSKTDWIKKPEKVYFYSENESISVAFENTEDDKRKFFEAMENDLSLNKDSESDSSLPDTSKILVGLENQNSNNSDYSLDFENESAKEADDTSEMPASSSAQEELTEPRVPIQNIDLNEKTERDIDASVNQPIQFDTTTAKPSDIVSPVSPSLTNQPKLNAKANSQYQPPKPLTFSDLMKNNSHLEISSTDEDSGSSIKKQVLQKANDKKKFQTMNEKVPIADAKATSSVGNQNKTPSAKSNAEAEYRNEIADLKTLLAKKEEEIKVNLDKIIYLESSLVTEKARFASAVGTDKPAESLKKDLQEQEVLIKGFQQENEKLTNQLKEARKLLSDNEQLNATKFENLYRENATLKNHINEYETMHRPTDNIKLKVAEEKIINLERELRIKDEEFSQLKKNYDAVLIDAKSNGASQIQTDSADEAMLRKEYEKKIKLQLEHIVKMEGQLRAQNHIQQSAENYFKRIKRYEILLSDIKNNVKEGKKPNTKPFGESRRIQILENQIKDLKEDLKLYEKSSEPLNILDEDKNWGIDVAKALQQRNLQLEIEIQDLHNNINQKVQDGIAKCEKDKLALIIDLDQLIAVNGELQEKVKIMQNNIEEYKSKEDNYSDRLAKMEKLNSELEISLEESNQKTKLLENEIQTQRRNFEAQLRKGEQEQAELENQNLSFQQKFKSQPAKEIESRYKALLEEEVAKNARLLIQIEMNENAKKSLQETTLAVLKQSQKETSKMAFTQSQRTFDILKAEWQKEQQIQFQLKLKPYTDKIRDLEASLADRQIEKLEFDHQIYKEKFQNLKIKFEELQVIHECCEKRFTSLRAAASPSLRELDILTEKIIGLEIRLQKKAQNIVFEPDPEVNLLEKKRLIEMEKELKLKNNQIHKFQKELEYLIEGIGLLKRDIA